MKSQLNKLEQKKYLADLQELRSEGLNIEIPSEWLEDARAIDIRVLSDGSTAFEGPAGTVFYNVHLRLTARRPHVILLDADLDTDWDHGLVLETLLRDKPIGRPKLFQGRKPISTDLLEQMTSQFGSLKQPNPAGACDTPTMYPHSARR